MEIIWTESPTFFEFLAYHLFLTPLWVKLVLFILIFYIHTSIRTWCRNKEQSKANG